MAELSRFQQKNEVNRFLGDNLTSSSFPVNRPELNFQSDGIFNPENGSNRVFVERKKDGLYVRTGQLLFKAAGLSTDNLHRLKIALRVSYPDDTVNSYTQILDLYTPEEKESFINNAFRETAIKASLIRTELKQLIAVLEDERILMLEGKLPDTTSEMSMKDKEKAIEYLKSNDLLNVISNDIEAMGLIGERKNALLLYLSLTSRMLPVPVSINILSRDSAGKSFLRDTVLSLLPAESIKQYTYISNKALLYDSKALNGKILAIDDTEGIKDCLPYLKSIISDQRISTLSTIADARIGQRSVQDISEKVSLSVIVSSSDLNLLNEDIRRLFLTITLDESQEQTRKIIENQIFSETAEGHRQLSIRKEIQKVHQNAQRLLKPLQVCFPDNLSISYPSNCIHNRRDMQVFISLVKSIALLHQYQRPVNNGIVYVMESDIETAIELSKEAFAVTHDDLSPQVRSVLSHIRSFVEEQNKKVPGNCIPITDITFSRNDIRKLCGLSESYLRIIFKDLLKSGFIGKITGRQGLQYSYVLLHQDNFAELRNDFALKAS